MLHVVLPQVSFKTIYLHLPGWFFHQVRPRKEGMGPPGATWLVKVPQKPEIPKSQCLIMFERFVQPFIIIFIHFPKPIGSMYGIYANIWGILMANVTIYGIISVILVGGWATPLKNMSSSIGMMRFPIYEKIKNGNQTTNQLFIFIHFPKLNKTLRHSEIG